MNDVLNGQGSEVRRGDGFAVTLCVAGFLAAVASYLLTESLLARQDTLSAFAPRDAAAYIHANGPAATALLARTAGASPVMRPDETAVYAVADEDGMAAWSVLVGWRAPSGPTTKERTELLALGAVRIDARRYLIDGAGTDRTGRLADDPRTSRALAAMRGLADVQFVVSDPGVVLGLAQDGAFDPGLAGPMAGALRVERDRFMLVTVPVDAAAATHPLLGFAMPVTDGGVSTPRPPAGADVALGETVPSFDVVEPMFAHVADGIDGERAARAAEELRAKLQVPVALALRKDPQEKRVEYVLHFPTVEPRALEDMVATYLASVWPSRRSVPLPDGDVMTEFRVDPERYRFLPLNGDATYTKVGPTDAVLVIGTDGKAGAYLSSDPEVIDRARSGRTVLAPQGPCRMPGKASLIIRRPELIAVDEPFLLGILNDLRTSLLAVIDLGDSAALVCGYSKSVVDN